MLRRVILLALCFVVVLAGCGKGGFSERKAEGTTTGNVFRYPIVTNPTTLDPGVVQDGDTIDLLQQVYEGLVQWGTDNTVQPDLAESWKIEDGGTTYVFTLKKGVKFHSGREMTADDVKWTIERNCDPALKTTTPANYLSDIVGVREKLEGKTKDIPGVEVVDAQTVKIKIDKPRPYFLGKLTYACAFILDKDVVPQGQEINAVEKMGGTGPFKAKQYEPEQLVVLEAFADYHGGKPAVDRIERVVTKDAATRLNKYKSEEIDLVMLERQDIDAIKKDDKLASHLKLFDRPAVWYIGMNQLIYPPFKDRRVRRAFAMAIDKEKIVNEFLGGVNKIANCILPPGVLGHRENAMGLQFNVAEAKNLLAEAGYPDGKGLPEFELTFREQRPDIRIVAEAVASMLKQNLGVNARLKTMEWRAYLEKHSADQMGFFHMRWAADYLDPENFLSTLLASYGAENHVGYSNPQFDALCREADTELDEQKRLQLYAQAEDMALQDAPFVPIYFQRDAELIRPSVEGLRESLFGHLPHTTVKIDASKK